MVWRVTSGDGHPIEGTFAFTATGGADAPATSDEPATVGAEPSGAPPVEVSERSPWPWVAGALVVVVAAVVVGRSLLGRRRQGAGAG